MSRDDRLAGLRHAAARSTIVVLDDDPTGTQAVGDVPVITAWDEPTLAALLGERLPLVYLLTNSRSLPEQAARDLARMSGEQLRRTSEAAGRPVRVVSRSDSTLRGHFPAEVDALAEGLGMPEAPVLLAPYFGEGGRVTIGGTHYLRQAERLIPVSETEFARDATFGYRSADLSRWVRERGSDRPTVLLPAGSTERALAERIAAAPQRAVLIADAADDADLERVAVAAAVSGRRLLARTAASYPRVLAGRPRAVPVSDEALRGAAAGPGLIVVGSHVALTTRQLERLLAAPPLPLRLLELDAARLRDGDRAIIRRAAARLNAALAAGTTAVLVTSRTPLPELDLAAGTAVAAGLVAILAGVTREPAWTLAKGGITSSDVARSALRIRRAQVLGPIVTGVPAWRAGHDSRWPGHLLVVFPGNVGDDDALRRTVERLAARTG